MVIDHTAGLLSAGRAVRAIAALAEAAGAEVREGTSVQRIVPVGGGLPVEAHGCEPVSARTVVHAAGAGTSGSPPTWQRKCARRVSRCSTSGWVPAPRQSRASRSSSTSARAGTSTSPRTTSSPWVMMTPARRASATTRESANPASVDEVAWREAEAFAAGVVPALTDLRRLRGIACLYTSSPSGRYLVYRRGAEVVVSACSGHGFKNGPSIGLLAARLALGTDAGPWAECFGVAEHWGSSS